MLGNQSLKRAPDHWHSTTTSQHYSSSYLSFGGRGCAAVRNQWFGTLLFEAAIDPSRPLQSAQATAFMRRKYYFRLFATFAV